ncbi:hypothetical protein P154DRAFT_212834 [Amniculicola lignicola CBS 123094]|uniref:Uncharacterized protein n=1 Tax=Amniculicola lignicola CBS 123094 TaxID=1392246 RepID=A0A6A5WE51_9PLEO|nr:hypothetical protein P154DRAFT_212834 [Amniculicola lignicola CBS 123094]
MYTMHNLDKTLPKPRKKPTQTSAQDIHQSFRAAALSVTNLYKSALGDLNKAQAEGYQEALEDLIGFLDKENLGVGDGEGWRIRQWAMEKVGGALPGQSNSDSDDEVPERARSSSPVMARNPSPEEVRASDPPHADTTQRCDSAPPPVHSEAPATDTEMAIPQNVFHFSSPQPLPADTNNDTAGPDFSAIARRAFPTPRRPSTRASRNLQRTAASNLFNLGNGAGQKRKIPDIFNIDFSDRRDGSGGGGGPKRGRMS